MCVSIGVHAVGGLCSVGVHAVGGLCVSVGVHAV